MELAASARHTKPLRVPANKVEDAGKSVFDAVVEIDVAAVRGDIGLAQGGVEFRNVGVGQAAVSVGDGSQGVGFFGQADAGIAFDDPAHVFRALVAHCRPAFELAVTLEFQYIEQWRVDTRWCRPVGVEVECGQ
jgi:hypothetical protein